MEDKPARNVGFGSKNFNEWYDASMDWKGRLARELPVLIDVFGPPGDGGIVDAGCGTGRHLCDLAAKGYRAVGADLDPQMLTIAREHAKQRGVNLELFQSAYADLFKSIGGGYDGIYCLANSVAAPGNAYGVAEALEQFAKVLRPGGRFCIEVLNFAPMLGAIKEEESESTDEGQNVPAPTDKGFLLDPERVRVTRIDCKTEEELAGKKEKRAGALYPVSHTEMNTWCAAAGLDISDRWGSFLREPFDPDVSIDLIVAGTKRG